MLHAEHLALQHPITGKVMDLRAPLPEDMASLLAALRKIRRTEKASRKSR